MSRRSIGRLCVIALFAVVACGAQAASADGERSIVFASYLDQELAERARRDLEGALAIDLHLVEAVVGGHRFQRLMSSPLADAEATNLMARARSLGFDGAWRTAAPPSVSARTASPSPPRSALEPTGVRTVRPSGRAIATPPKTTSPAPPAPSVLPSIGGTANASGALPLPRFDGVDVRIDGHLDEAIWGEVAAYDNMTVVSPDTLETPQYETKTRFFYTDQGFYVGMHAMQPPETRIARLSSRDAFLNRDGMSVTLDPSGEGLYGYYFGVSLGGSLSDGTVLPERSFSRDWDGPWRGATAETPDGWTAEIFVPWSTMPMPTSGRERDMGLYVSRSVGHLLESWSWPALPFTQPLYLSALQPISLADVEPRQEFSFFPYTSAAYDNVRDQEKYRAGLDIFWRPRPSLQVTATANPDFGNVEADDVVVNLTAFETFFPEKRLFFLEGVDIFETGSSARRGGSRGSSSGGRFFGIAGSGFNFVSNKLVHMRRIGARPRSPIVPDGFAVDSFDLAEPSDLLGAAKVTGQTGAIRFGALAAFEDDTDFIAMANDASVPATTLESTGRDFGVLRGLWESTAGGGRRSVGVIGTFVDHPDRSSTVVGLDMTHQSKTGAVDTGGLIIASDVDDLNSGEASGLGFQGTVIYRPRRGVFAGVGFDYYDDELNFNDFGFMRRNDYASLRGNISFNGSNWGPFRTWSSFLFGANEFNTDGQFVSSQLRFSNSVSLHNRSSIRAALTFQPTTLDDRSSRGNGVFRIDPRWGFDTRFESDPTKKLAYRMSLQFDEEDLGGLRSTAQVGLAYAPSDRLSIVGLVDYVDNDGWLLYRGDTDFTTFSATQWKPKLNVDVFFNARQQLRLALQWAGIVANEQSFYSVPDSPGDLLPRLKAPDADPDDFAISNVTLQVRYRWQIAPLSDLFVVYTRASNPSGLEATLDFDDLLTNAFENPLLEGLIMKLRYRFGR